MASDIGCIELHVLRFNRELAAVGHGVPRVDGEVQDDLFQLARIGLDGHEIGCQPGAQLHILPEKPPQQLVHVGDHLVGIQRRRGDDLLAAEGQELAGEVRRPQRGLPDLLEFFARWNTWCQAVQHEVGGAEDGREQVVEVVGHSPREPADRLHLLRLVELLFQLLALRDVEPGAEDLNRQAGWIAQQPRFIMYPPVGPALSLELVFEGEFALREKSGELGEHARPVAGVEVTRPPRGVKRLRHVITQDPGNILAHPAGGVALCGQFRGVDHGGTRGKDIPQTRLGGTQGVLRLFTLGDVEEGCNGRVRRGCAGPKQRL